MLKQIGKPDYILISTTFILVFIGMLMIFSASFDVLHLRRQFISFLLGFMFFVVGGLVDYRFYKKLIIPLMFFSLILLIFTYIPGLAYKAGGATRWLNFAGFIFQPSELIKMILIIFTAIAIENKQNLMKSFTRGVLPIMMVVGVFLILIMAQPDLGTTLLLSSVIISMLFIAGIRFWHLGVMVLVGLRSVFWVVENSTYQKNRILAFLDPWKDSLGIGFNTIQSLLAVGSGGICGLGLGNSNQKFSYLPQPFTDYIYAIICEETGFLGAILVIVLFFIFAIRGFRTARLAPDRYGTMLAFGITSWIVLEAMLNMGVVLGLVPPTGIPLVFISLGGSSLLVSLFAVGVLVNISRHSNYS